MKTTEIIRINIKPLSVNEAWQGKRFKTDKYKDYELVLLYKLPLLKIDASHLRLDIIVGYSNSLADIDNFLKPFLDILQKKYAINDKNIYELIIKKEVTKKKEEFIQFTIIYLQT